VVLDVLALPPLGADEQVITSDCFIDKVADYSLIVVGVWDDKASSASTRRIRAAWRPNIESGKFESVDAGRVWCGYDEDRD
jgi:hypothetical protein